LTAKAKKEVLVADIIRLMECIAPAVLAEDWDNCGLQVGALHWPVQKIWVALDPLLPVIEDAGRRQVDMVITHHPLIFRALQRVSLDTAEGRAIAAALKTRTAVFAAHTNLDSAVGGINDVLARKIGLQQLCALVAAESGATGADSTAARDPAGIGRIGTLASPLPVGQWAGAIKKQLGLESVKVAGNMQMEVQRAAVCSGSGGGLMTAFLHSDADVFVSGDLRYHDARAVEDAGRAFIDIGHFASESIIIEALADTLRSAIQAESWDVQVEPCRSERDPFKLV